MAMGFTNSGVAKLLRSIAAAYILKNIGNIFQIRAYETAADAIEHSTAEIRDLWEDGKLDQVPGLGEKISGYLEELFKTGRVKHFEDVKKGIPDIVFELLDIPGIGPKTASKIADFGIKDITDLRKQIDSGQLIKKGFSQKIAEKISKGLLEVEGREKRTLLPYAYAQAEKVIAYLTKSEDAIEAHPLGSLRRMVATVGDLDFSVSSNNPKKVVEYFIKMPGISRILDKGDTKASVVLNSGLQLDLLVGEPNFYGALLQHFTGSKHHNIHIRTLASSQSLSLSEYGVKNTKTGKTLAVKTEKEFYKLLKMQTPAPELREDTGEIEASLKNELPQLIETGDIKGDLHLHSNFPLKNLSHGPGIDSMEEIIKKATSLGYEYVGISDHPPGFTALSEEEIIEWVKKRTNFIQRLKKQTNSARVLNGLEIDILGNGKLSVPDEALKMLDYCIAGIHSGHRGEKEKITSRLLKALESPYVDIISHPTNRLLNERESSDADWEAIFKHCVKYNKILEINAFPNRLDLRDDLVRAALQFKVKFVINTDAHAIEQMDNMKYGVAVARRGWVGKEDVVNAWNWTKFAKWFKIKQYS